MIQDIRPIVYSITINGTAMRLRYDMNALDYLERTSGSIQEAFDDASIRGQKQIIRAALLCNYPENKRLLDEGRLDEMKPSLSEIGEWFDASTMGAVASELYRISLEQMDAGEGEKRRGEPAEILADVIGVLYELYGSAKWDEAMRIFGGQRPAKS